MEQKWVDKYGISTYGLKMIALVSMLIDHIGVFICRYESELYWICRIVGRLSFPIFAFCLVKGFIYTKNKVSYGKRLFIFSIISEVPFDLAAYLARKNNHFVTRNRFLFFDFHHQNVFFTLLIGFLTILCISEFKKNVKIQNNRELLLVLEIMTVAAGCLLAWGMHTDYGYAGVTLIVLFYLFEQYVGLTVLSNLFFNFVLYGGIQGFGALTIVFIYLYNGKAGNKKMKWFFYIFYPAHLMVIAIADYLILMTR